MDPHAKTLSSPPSKLNLRGDERVQALSTSSCSNPQRLKDCQVLPEDFEPLPYSVVIGRGHVAKASTGNRRLDVIASSFLPRYTKSTAKAAKTEIVTEIIATIRNACPVGSFIRYADGRWWEVDESTVREKVGYCLRNLLHDKYSTSAKSKTASRRRQRQHQDSNLRVKVASGGSSRSCLSISAAKNSQKVVRWAGNSIDSSSAAIFADTATSTSLGNGQDYIRQAIQTALVLDQNIGNEEEEEDGDHRKLVDTNAAGTNASTSGSQNNVSLMSKDSDVKPTSVQSHNDEVVGRDEKSKL